MALCKWTHLILKQHSIAPHSCVLFGWSCNAASHLSKFEACHCVSWERSQGVHQSEGHFQKTFLQNGLLFSSFCDLLASLCLCSHCHGYYWRRNTVHFLRYHHFACHEYFHLFFILLINFIVSFCLLFANYLFFPLLFLPHNSYLIEEVGD